MDLVIGETSQIAHYFPKNIVKVSSRNVPNEIFEVSWNRVYLCFAEQRTRYAKNLEYKESFDNINVLMTLDIAQRLKANQIIYYSTTELWNACSCAISLNLDFNFESDYYTDSKHRATVQILKLENSVILYPFNFNSSYRSSDYLFGKIFSSIQRRERVQVGNLDQNRDILHASWVAKQSLGADSHRIIGSGSFINVKNYVIDLYNHFGLSFNELVSEDADFLIQKKPIYLESDKVMYTYSELLKDTVDDLQNTSS